jgi:hypothetical protein
MKTFNPTAYGPTIADFLREERLAPLGPGSPNRSVRAVLEAGTTEKLFGDQGVRDRHMADACRAGLWLYHDFLDESHKISQDIDTPTGSYWHAIMHRREPDPSNSKYWWRRVGSHPVLQQLVEQAPSLGCHFTDPFAFVDFVERVRDTGTADEETARRVQRLEWELLFDHCYRKALGA